MSAAAVVKALAPMWPTLRKYALQIGRWLIETIAEEGLRGLVIYMRQRVKVFARRKARVVARRRRNKSKRGKRFEVENWRVRWLSGRIRRWNTAIAWLQSKAAAKLKGKLIDLAVERAKREIPEEAPDEDFARWRRRQRKSS